MVIEYFPNGVSALGLYNIMSVSQSYAKAIITCDIAAVGDKGICYPNEKIMVRLSSREGNVVGRYYTTCESPNDFLCNIVVGEENARAQYCGYYVANFKKIEIYRDNEVFLFTLVNLSASDAEVNGEYDSKLYKSYDKAVSKLNEWLLREKREYETNHRGCIASIERVSDELVYLWFNPPYEGITFEVKAMCVED